MSYPEMKVLLQASLQAITALILLGMSYATSAFGSSPTQQRVPSAAVIVTSDARIADALPSAM